MSQPKRPKLDARLADRESLRKAIERREAANRRDRGRIIELDAKIADERIRGLCGVTNGVRRRYRDAHHMPELNDALGTITEVRRTRCTVVYELPDGTETTVDAPLDGLLPAGQPQGEFVSV